MSDLLTQDQRDALDASVTRCRLANPHDQPLRLGVFDGLFYRNGHTLECATCGSSWALWWPGIYRHPVKEHMRLVARV